MSVIDVLMKRDRLTKDEAVEIVREAKELILQNPDEADEIMMYDLGLEPDYLEEVLYV